MMHGWHTFYSFYYMAQLNFFGDSTPGDILPADLLDYRPALLNTAESNQLLHALIHEVPWTQRSVLMYGKEVLTPRLTAWYGDADANPSLTAEKATTLPWRDDLLMVKHRVEQAAGLAFNSVLLNYYRNGNDSVSWHSDNDGIPGRNRVVASVSLGQVRRFDIRNNADHTRKYAIDLENGSCLLMKGSPQDEWQHRIAKSTKATKERVNLTFRIMK